MPMTQQVVWGDLRVAPPEPPEWLEEFAPPDIDDLAHARYLQMLAEEQAERDLYYSIEDDHEWIRGGC